MKYNFILLFILFYKCLSLPLDKIDGKIKYHIDLGNGKITYEGDVNERNYAYRVETSDGTIKHEKANFINDNFVISGGYEYIGTNGLKYIVTYTANENGFNPKVQIGSKTDNIVRLYPTPTLPTRLPEIRPPTTEPSPTYRPAEPTYVPPTVGIDPALLCSLAGSGCK